jgi:hypothetical protein
MESLRKSKMDKTNSFKERLSREVFATISVLEWMEKSATLLTCIEPKADWEI